MVALEVQSAPVGKTTLPRLKPHGSTAAAAQKHTAAFLASATWGLCDTHHEEVAADANEPDVVDCTRVSNAP